MQAQKNTPLTQAKRVGIDEAVKAAYAAIDKSDLPADEKRSLLFSVYSFRCLFDNSDMLYIHPILYKHGCTDFCSLTDHPFYTGRETEFDGFLNADDPYIPYGGILVPHNGGIVVRYDAGSPVWQELLARGRLSAKMLTVPEKYDLYDMTYEIINLNTADNTLLALWYLSFPYVMLIGAPHDPDLYEIILETLTDKKILDAVLESKYSLSIPDSAEELSALEIPNHIIAFYRPYLSYLYEKDLSGVARVEKRFQSWLGKGRFADVYAGTEKFLNTDPYNDGILLCNIAARVSLEPAAGKNERTALLKETLSLIESALERGSEKRIYLHYYAGLCHLGLGNRDGAAANFIACTDINPSFHPALQMLNALKKEV